MNISALDSNKKLGWGKKKKKAVLKADSKHSLPGRCIYDKITLAGIRAFV